MNFAHFLSANGASATEKAMHAVHETMGWIILTAAAAVLILGAVQTYLFHHDTEVELTAAFNGRSLPKAMRCLSRKYIHPLCQTMFLSGIASLSNMYLELEVGVIDRFNYVAAGAIHRFSNLLYKYADTAIIDRFNYTVADSAVELSSLLRKTHTGVLSYNMTLVGVAFVIYLILLLYIG